MRNKGLLPALTLAVGMVIAPLGLQAGNGDGEGQQQAKAQAQNQEQSQTSNQDQNQSQVCNQNQLKKCMQAIGDLCERLRIRLRERICWD